MTIFVHKYTTIRNAIKRKSFAIFLKGLKLWNGNLKMTGTGSIILWKSWFLCFSVAFVVNVIHNAFLRSVVWLCETLRYPIPSWCLGNEPKMTTASSFSCVSLPLFSSVHSFNVWASHPFSHMAVTLSVFPPLLFLKDLLSQQNANVASVGFAKPFLWFRRLVVILHVSYTVTIIINFF